MNLLAHGGIAMCGGRDFDLALFDQVVQPWLLEHFDLPADFAADPSYRPLLRMATWAAEKAKIELSQRDDTLISLSETELGVRDRAGAEVFLDIPLERARYDALIAPKLDESIAAAREALDKAGLQPGDVERMVFIGGPAHYKPLRDRVASALGIEPSLEVNPMTAVAEGAAVFAESIDWESQGHGRKRSSSVHYLDPQEPAVFATVVYRTTWNIAMLDVLIKPRAKSDAPRLSACLKT